MMFDRAFLCVDFRTKSSWVPVTIVTRAIFTVAKSVNIAGKFTVDISSGEAKFIIFKFETAGSTWEIM